jgi:hypothetical protein
MTSAERLFYSNEHGAEREPSIGYGVTANIAASHRVSRQLGVRFPVPEFFFRPDSVCASRKTCTLYQCRKIKDLNAIISDCPNMRGITDVEFKEFGSKGLDKCQSYLLISARLAPVTGIDISGTSRRITALSGKSAQFALKVKLIMERGI